MSHTHNIRKIYKYILFQVNFLMQQQNARYEKINTRDICFKFEFRYTKTWIYR